MDHVTDADLKQDFGIEVRLHRVKITEGIKRLQQGNSQNQRRTPNASEQYAREKEKQMQNQAMNDLNANRANENQPMDGPQS